MNLSTCWVAFRWYHTVDISSKIIVYYVMRSKNEVLCAVAGRLAAERRSAANLPAKAHKTIFAPNNCSLAA
jgi:hypothetical protein